MHFQFTGGGGLNGMVKWNGHVWTTRFKVEVQIGSKTQVQLQQQQQPTPQQHLNGNF